MRAEDLVDGAEYEGIWYNGDKKRGLINRRMDRANPAPAGFVNLWQSGNGYAFFVAEYTLRPVSPATCSYFKTQPPVEPERSLCELYCTGDEHEPGCARRRPDANDLAWKLREETLAAEERKRRHLEERERAYESQRGDTHGERWLGNVTQYQALRTDELDRAIARAKPADDAPAYVNLNWPPADETDP